MIDPSPRYTIQQLAQAAGVKARTVRKWLGAGALSTTEFRGRGTTYGPRHVDEIRAIRKLLAENLSLAAIRGRLAGLSSAELAKIGGDFPLAAALPGVPKKAPEARQAPTEPTYPADAWERIELLPGLELHVRRNGGTLLQRVAQDIYDHYRRV